MIPHFFRIRPLPETLLAQIRASDRQACSIPVLLDFSALKTCADLKTMDMEKWLSAEEKDRFLEFKLQKRQIEWLAGRIGAKIAVRDYFRTHFRDQKMPADNEIVIANSAGGRPFIARIGKEVWRQAPDISISHSGDLSLALAAATCCGVDVQRAVDTLTRVKERFCATHEERLLAGVQESRPLIPLALLWAAKEAAKKALSILAMPGFSELVLTGIDRTCSQVPVFIFTRHRHQTGPPEKIRVATACHQTSAIGICIP
ncbi:MAG: 4'-phosphopantetheinyl transferase superfamily protein [Desulfocapsaceae bacterium]|nr:4'-phosphopantetheinyl transferase superfamily protein [Desulfocapsaceae bacterium]